MSLVLYGTLHVHCLMLFRLYVLVCCVCRYYYQNRDGVVESHQSGVFRANCMDCLDRTNVVQSMLARRSLLSQLRVAHTHTHTVHTYTKCRQLLISNTTSNLLVLFYVEHYIHSPMAHTTYVHTRCTVLWQDNPHSLRYRINPGSQNTDL